MKTCNVCKTNKSITEFFRDSSRDGGYSLRCKDCERILKRKIRATNPEMYSRRDSRYYQKHRDVIREARKRWYKKNRLKSIAHQKVKTALLNGKITRQASCEECGSNKPMAHHDDYTKPLDVRWLCGRCHMMLHHGKSLPPSAQLLVTKKL